MTTATLIKVEAAARVPWDRFLNEQGSTLPDDVRVGHLAVLKRHVNDFRSRDWKEIRRELKSHYGIELPDGLEPHWVAPTKAVMWHRPVTQKVRGEADENNDGRTVMVLEDEVADWQPSHVVTIGNAGNLAYQLRKGLRLRPPPSEGDESVELLEVASSPGSTGEPPIDPNPYVCNRHPGRGAAKFPVWKAYQRHCQDMNESLEMEPPQEVIQALRQYPYYCPSCFVAFTSSKAARMHVSDERQTPKQVAGQHINFEQMMMRAIQDTHPAQPASSVEPTQPKKRRTKSKRSK